MLNNSLGEPTIQTVQLSKSYGNFAALTDCSMHASHSEILGLLGPNGAGKTTLLRILLGFLKPTSGSARVLGIDAIHHSVAARRQIAYLPAEAKFPGTFRARHVMEMWAGLHPLGDFARARQLAERLDLDLDCRVGRMSTGMRQKLGLCVVLSIRTPVVILDEPTANLDPTIRAEVLTLVREAKQAGATVVFSNHVLSEIESTCDRVILLQHGKLVREAFLEQLRQRFRLFVRGTVPLPDLPSGLTDTRTISATVSRSELVLETASDLNRLLGWLAAANPSVLRIEPIGLQDEYDLVHGRRGQS